TDRVTALRPSAGGRRTEMRSGRWANGGRSKNTRTNADREQGHVNADGRPRPTRRGVLLGASLAGLGGALAGCSTAAVPYDANEAGVVEKDTPAASGGSSS